MVEFITRTGKNTVSMSLVKNREFVVYDYHAHACSVNFTVHTVKNSVRHRKIGTAVFRYLKDRQWYPHHVQVIEEYQRRGVASAMYDIAQSIVPGQLIPSDEQSTAARLFWQHRLARSSKAGDLL